MSRTIAIALAVASTAVTAAAVVGAGGCIELPGNKAPLQCKETAECDAEAGEVCSEGLCYGNPPRADYSAVVGPNATRPDLVVTEIETVNIAQDGETQDLAIDSPVTVSGQIRLACQPELTGCTVPVPIAATISVSRRSRIVGGSDYRITAEAMRPPSATSFSLSLPPLRAGDDPYTFTIVPAPGGDSPIDPQALAPPARIQVSPTSDPSKVDILLGGDGPRLITGKILDGAGRAVARARVAGYGRWDDGAALERVTNLARTRDDGSFRLLVAGKALATVDLVVQAPETTAAPLLRVHDVDASSLSRSVGELRLPSFQVPETFKVQVSGFDSSGAETRVRGATVTLTASISDGLGSADQEATFEATATTDSNGEAPIALIPGTATAVRQYSLRINPPAESPFASVYGRTMLVGSRPGTLPLVRLPQRTSIVGVVVGGDGQPVEGVTIAARPAVRFTWTLDDATQTLLQSVTAPTHVTASDGSFVIFVDPDVAGQAAAYDLECEPPTGALVPRWTESNVAAGASHDVQLPEAAFVRGQVHDRAGKAVTGAEVRIYARSTDTTCAAGPYKPGGACEQPASLLALGRADAGGWVRLVLPRSP